MITFDIARPVTDGIKWSDLTRLSTDLEPATKTISATAESATPDYTYAVTGFQAAFLNYKTGAADARADIKRLVVRLLDTIDSLNGGCAHVYLRAYFGTDNLAAHRILDLDLTTAASHINAVDLHASAFAASLALVKAGNTTLYFHLWVDTGNAVLSALTPGVYVGTCSNSTRYEVLRFTTGSGIYTYQGWVNRAGSGTADNRLMADYTIHGNAGRRVAALGSIADAAVPCFTAYADVGFSGAGSVAADANAIESGNLTWITL